MNMLRITRFDWNFSSTAEAATGLMLLAVCLVVVFLA
jgi:hypothetical protein